MAKKQENLASKARHAVRKHARWVVLGVMLVVCGIASRRVWESLHEELINSPRYKITADTLHFTPEVQPPWIRSDVKAQVLRDTGITNSLTLLDPPVMIQQRLVDAFELHPWVRKVESVDLVGPGRVEITVTYREPVAVAEVQTDQDRELLPVDAFAVRLPDNELTDVEKSYLPRITTIEDRPLVGQAWSDTRMQGAAQLADRLRPVWERFSLLDIVPSTYPEVQRSHRFYTYEIRSSGGTVIRWGAAPGFSPPGESTFEDKLARITGWFNTNGGLDSINAPESIDVRDSLHVSKQMAKKESSDGEKVR
ncbi:cell division protein FtsQ/DivIB [Aeoliella sp. SH292]|uniref:cell division protein FtsQ/DivIB n=1 Tax=Aeoliella sp. SH292 TaxID=3454464 RepID=UPI003F9DAA49